MTYSPAASPKRKRSTAPVRLRTSPFALALAITCVAGLTAGCILAPTPGTSDSPSGSLDAVTLVSGGVRIQGWTSDWNTTDPISVVVWLNGMLQNGVFVADKPRPDVDAAFGRGSNYGFDERLNAPVGPVTVCVSAVNVGPGDNSLLGCRTASAPPIVGPKPPAGPPTPAPEPPAPEPAWRTVVNNGDAAPGTGAVFNSYNQPSVNSSGLVAFRARTQGKGTRGVYSRQATDASAGLDTIADINTLVPQPNNLDSEFTEFPSIPRIDREGSLIATRGQSAPVWTYTPDGGEETRAGTTGIYATANGTLSTGASLLGAVPGFEEFAVPGVTPTTRFDQFPGSPAVDGTSIVFKGNFTVDEIGQTGIFYRDLSVADSPTQVIASSATVIPDQPADGDATGVTFGSTAPPSAADGKVVFVGLDIEEAPTMGGVYLAPLAPTPVLDPLVSIGDPVPGGAETDYFARIGEGLSFDGRFVSFWGAWGETEEITLECPEDGNKDLLAFCNSAHPEGFVAETYVHQGIFVHDTVADETSAVALADRADPEAEYSTFEYWTFSGKPPTDTGDSDAHLPRWRSSAFAAVSGEGGGYKVAFKANKGEDTTGIYLADSLGGGAAVPVVETNDVGPDIDPEAPEDTFVTSLGVERDGFRGRYLALNVGMANADASVSWAGIYLVAVDRLETSAPLEKAPLAPTPEQPHVREEVPA